MNDVPHDGRPEIPGGIFVGLPVVPLVPLAGAADVRRVGGKAANLGRLLRAGFDVPDGFVLPVGTPIDDAAIVAAYRRLGSGTVAVRSSAAAEDAAAASMAGQYETVLNVVGEDTLLAAVRHCRAAESSDRVQAYLDHFAAEDRRASPAPSRREGEEVFDTSGLAVLVQRQVCADFAGVLFTAAPDDAHPGGPRQMLIEAAWGMGESVVSGRVQPDVLRVAADDGRVVSATIANKAIELVAGGERAVAADRQTRPCLTSANVHRLWQLGRQVEAHFGGPQDIEWAIAGDRLYLLQSRPITTHADAEAVAGVITTAKASLHEAVAAGQGPWVVHNLGETLPHPTPLTWSVVGRFMSAAGGYGTAYRRAGFAPGVDGFLELIAGRVYMDAARAPRMFAADFPFAYDLETLRRSPDVSQSPPTLAVGSVLARLRAGRRLRQVHHTLSAEAVDLDRRLRDDALPALARYVAEAKRVDLAAAAADEIASLWAAHETRVMDEFGPLTVTAGLVAGLAMDALRAFLSAAFWNEDADALARTLSSGGPADRTAEANAALYEVGVSAGVSAAVSVGVGGRPLAAWLAAHGHRGVNEFDLSASRWHERPDDVAEAAARLVAGGSPEERQRIHRAEVDRRIDTLDATLSPADRAELARTLGVARRYVAFREDGKDALMLGYDLLRDVALEIGRRTGAGDGVFYLTREEMLAVLRTGYAPLQVIDDRRRTYRAEARVRLARVIDTGAIDTLGAPAVEAAGDAPAGLAVSAGEAVGPALVLHSPEDAGRVSPGYVLVCPSTDPSWTPLFAGAAGLVIERGGVLSHGAVVAREMGLPAVVLPDATRRFKTDDPVRVDGTRGHAGLAGDALVETTITAADTRLTPAQLPPPPGRRDMTAARWRNAAALAWAVFLLGYFLLPGQIVATHTIAIINASLWPSVRHVGGRVTVALVAAMLAVVTLTLQRTLTDNPRLLEAKRRAATLRRQARRWPLGSPRRLAMTRAATAVTGRTLGASLVPVGLLLGPMVLTFVWLGLRLGPAGVPAPAGSAVRVIATVDGEWTGPLTLVPPAGMAVDTTTPATQTLPPLRATLERLLALYRQPRPAAAGEPWELGVAPDAGRRQTADDLRAYLDAGLPPQAVSWTVRTPAGYDGAFDVAVTSPGAASSQVRVAVGDSRPPPAGNSSAAAPVLSLRAVCPRPSVETAFWRPLAWLGRWPLVDRLSGFDVGWIGVYVAAYVVTLAVVRRVFRVA